MIQVSFDFICWNHHWQIFHTLKQISYYIPRVIIARNDAKCVIIKNKSVTSLCFYLFSIHVPSFYLLITIILTFITSCNTNALFQLSPQELFLFYISYMRLISKNSIQIIYVYFPHVSIDSQCWCSRQLQLVSKKVGHHGSIDSCQKFNVWFTLLVTDHSVQLKNGYVFDSLKVNNTKSSWSSITFQLTLSIVYYAAEF